MVEKVEIKDKDGQISIALRAAGYNINQKQVEEILNIVDFIRNNDKDTTLKDIVSLQVEVGTLFDD